METSRDCMRICILVLYLCIAIIFVTPCDARSSMQLFKGLKNPRISIINHMKKSKVMKHLDVAMPFDSTNTNPYGVSSPFSLPPFDSLAPISLPENSPPFCLYPPLTPQSPSTSIPTPIGYNPSPSLSSPSPPPPFYYISPILPIYNPPPSPSETVPSPYETIPPPSPSETVPSPSETIPPPTPSETVPSPPDSSYTPNPPESGLSPPSFSTSPPEFALSPPIYIPSPSGSTVSPPFYEPSPPSFVPNPPSSYNPTPGGGFVPTPPVFQPPVVFPPPAVPPPPPQRGQSLTLWCVAKPSVPDPIIEEAMNYACGSGADCMSIQPSGSCYEPNTLFAHASYAFNSYWQRTKVAGGTCDFGGTAILVTVDPSFDGCQFQYN